MRHPAARTIHAVDLLRMIEKLVQNIRTVRGEEHLAAIRRLAQGQFAENLDDLMDQLRMHAVLGFLNGDYGRDVIEIEQAGDGEQAQHAIAHLLAVEDNFLAVALVQAEGAPAPALAGNGNVREVREKPAQPLHQLSKPLRVLVLQPSHNRRQMLPRHAKFIMLAAIRIAQHFRIPDQKRSETLDPFPKPQRFGETLTISRRIPTAHNAGGQADHDFGVRVARRPVKPGTCPPLS